MITTSIYGDRVCGEPIVIHVALHIEELSEQFWSQNINKHDKEVDLDSHRRLQLALQIANKTIIGAGEGR